MMMQSRFNLCVTVSLLLCIETTTAVPAIVWHKSEPAARDVHSSDASYYISNEISFEELLTSESSSMNTNNDDITVLFLLERDSKTGQEILTSTTPMLQQTLQHPLAATPKQYSHVTGMESGAHVLKKCKACATSTITTSPIMEPVLVNLNELGYKLNHTLSSSALNTEMMMDVVGDTTSMLPPKTNTNKAAVKVSKRNRLIESSNFVIVTVPSTMEVEVLDATLVQTLQHSHVQTVVLSSVRGVNEVKYERHLSMKRQLLDKAVVVDTTTSSKTTTTTTTDPYHRRLDQQQNNNNNNNLSGTYYVQMTPNIFSGLLFFGLFTVVTMIGVSCMNMITGQDVYVSTMPSIGREA
jgi:hypothetical protein